MASRKPAVERRLRQKAFFHYLRRGLSAEISLCVVVPIRFFDVNDLYAVARVEPDIPHITLRRRLFGFGPEGYNQGLDANLAYRPSAAYVYSLGDLLPAL
jgi:hypothetical protein